MLKLIINQSAAKKILANIEPNKSITGSDADLARILSDKKITSNKKQKK
jgi:hypothetical protein